MRGKMEEDSEDEESFEEMVDDLELEPGDY